ncbi:MAG: NUDIX hydrolase [Lentihominibacter sp.]|jgi:coenzyme A diphosphatase NUDT7
MNKCDKITTDRVRQIFSNYKPVGEMDFRHFAVLVPIVEGPDGPEVLYEVRAHDMDRQPGEVCFPGGMIEPDESPLECALRETEEEIGIPASDIDILGELSAVHMIAGSRIYCFVGAVSESGMKKLTLNPDEVAEVFTVGLDKIMATKAEVYSSIMTQVVDEKFPYERVTGRASYPWRNKEVPVPVYFIDDRIIWGMTGRMTMELAEVLECLE